MRINALLLALMAILFLCFGLQGCAGLPVDPPPLNSYTDVYLQNNIHYYVRLDSNGRRINRASYANYTEPGGGHKITPVNTSVTVGKWRGGFTITRKDTGELIYFEYKASNMGGMEIEAYLNVITSTDMIYLRDLSATDLKGIAEGRAQIGMTKRGIRIALGYPARHRTPSLEENNWTYWRNRFGTRAVVFDPKGEVIHIR